MDLRNRLSYHRRLFLFLMLFSWSMVACVLVFQYNRERMFRAELLDTRLQAFNRQLLEELADGVPLAEFMAHADKPFHDLRVTLVDRQGNLLFDNTLDSLPDANHLNRPEIAAAVRDGQGYDVRRHSQTVGKTFFYSATAGRDIVVRSAVPYSLPLEEVLATDRTFLWFMLGITLLFSIMGYFFTRRLGHIITRLNRFAQKAEHGERIYADDAFPNNELGEISNHIVRLYAQLQTAISDRDRQHRIALHEEQEKIRIKKQLTNNINHELKTPLSAIMACLETLMAHEELPAEKRNDFLKRCYENGERLRRLLNDVSLITRMDDGTQLISKEPLVLNDLIREAAAQIQWDGGNGMKLHIRIPETIRMTGNASLLLSLFSNLMDNAKAYSGGRNACIDLLSQTEEECRLSFADDGKGVDEQHLPYLFERFYRVDKGRSRKMGGTGLGLAIVKNAVLLHGGTIAVGNRPQGGLEFIFTLKKKG